MSKATKRKHVVKEVEEDLGIPTETQSIVQIIASRGNNLHEVSEASGDHYLVSMPTKYRKNVWVKRGDYVLVEPIAEGDKVKGEIVKILRQEHIRFYRSQNCWPGDFEKAKETVGVNSDGEEDLFVNTNRRPQNHNTTGEESDTSTKSSDSD